jgi:rubrerythrin
MIISINQQLKWRLVREPYILLQEIVMTIDPNTLSTPMAILEAALGREKAAHQFYGQLLNNTNIGMLREIIEHLIEEEYKHIQLIEKKMAALRNG